MQKFFFFICVFVSFLLSIQSYAAVITVDANHPSAGMYKNLQNAHDAANSGDTILVYPFAGKYSGIAVKKRLRIVGRGWYDVAGKNISTAISGSMIFSEGSDGSSLEGFEYDYGVDIDANNITIKRNDLNNIDISSGHVGTVVIQNYIKTKGCIAINVEKNNEVFISNNIIYEYEDTYGYDWKCEDYGILASDNSITINIVHNVIAGYDYSLSVYKSNYYVANNIIIGGWIKPKDHNGFHNNICHTDQLYTSHGNMINVDMNTVYGSSWYQLKENSPAIGNGTNGVDIGIHGGSTPFVLGGYPSIPRIVDIEADHLGTKSHGLDVKIKATTVRE
jgi:hypothetical protein